MGAIPFSGSGGTFIRGDATGEGNLNLTDAVVILDYLFRGAAPPACLDRLDVNDDGAIDIVDPIYLLVHLYAGGPPPPAPFLKPGTDLTDDDLPCP